MMQRAGNFAFAAATAFCDFSAYPDWIIVLYCIFCHQNHFLKGLHVNKTFKEEKCFGNLCLKIRQGLLRRFDVFFKLLVALRIQDSSELMYWKPLERSHNLG
jgi:hypothetical protein